MKPFTLKIQIRPYRWEDDSQDFQPIDTVDPVELKGGTLFPGSDDD